MCLLPSISNSLGRITLKIQTLTHIACATNGANLVALLQNEEQFS
jgi:hypothetical protein